jgi:hypothetical protein
MKHYVRDFQLCRRDMERVAARRGLFGKPEQDIRRGEIRFATEALLAERHGERLPLAILDRALAIAHELALN